MRGQLVKAIRQQASKARDQAIGAVSGAVTDAFHNEQLTRKRVDALERRMSEAVIHRKSLLGRLRWLFLGR